MSEEEWRPVVGLEGHFEISSLGRVRSVDRIVEYRDGRRRLYKGKILKTFIVAGYEHLVLKVNRVPHNRYIHGMVCAAFHGPRPSPDHEARHLNGNALDNHAGNLAWGTKSENALDTVRHGNNQWANKTHCPQNHEYTPENTRYTTRGGRLCAICQRASNRRFYRKNRVAKSVAYRRRREAQAAAEGRVLRTHRNSLYEEGVA